MRIIPTQEAKSAFQPTRYWGPALPIHRRLMRKYMEKDEFELNPWQKDKELEAQLERLLKEGQ